MIRFEEIPQLIMLTNVPNKVVKDSCDLNVNKFNDKAAVEDVGNKTTLSDDTTNTTDQHMSTDFIPSDLDSSENNYAVDVNE